MANSAPPFIPYFIDYNVKNQSKTIGVSKKAITFKFGFANRQAIDDGLVGAHCRGSEHEVVFTWSLNSGKRHVTLDGKDVHFSTSGQNGWTSDRTWQHVFSLKVPGYSGTFRCHLISQPAPQGSNIRPFDLRVGGVSIFKFNQIFQLGTPQMTVRKPGGSRATYSASADDEPMTAEERRMLAAARVESMKEYRKQQERESAMSASARENGGAPAAASASSGGDTDLLMSFDGPPAPVIPVQQPPGQMVSSMTMGSEFLGSTNSFPGSPPPGQSPYGYPQQQPQQSPYGYPPHQNYGQPPPQQHQHQQQQSNYGQSPYGDPFGSPQPGSTASFGGSATTVPTTNTAALTPYQAPAGQAQAPAGYSLGSSFNSFAPNQSFTQAPAASVVASLDPYAKPPADPWATPAPAAPPVQSSSFSQSSYGQPPPPEQYGGYGQSQSSFQNLQSPTNDTQASFGTYGSAPDFARPPQAQQPQYQQQGYGQQPNYGQPPGNPYGAPPQYQQQSFGF